MKGASRMKGSLHSREHFQSISFILHPSFFIIHSSFFTLNSSPFTFHSFLVTCSCPCLPIFAKTIPAGHLQARGWAGSKTFAGAGWR